MDWSEVNLEWVEMNKKHLMEYMSSIIKVDTKDIFSYSIRYHDATFFKVIALNIMISHTGELTKYSEEKTVCILTNNNNIKTDIVYDRSIAGFLEWLREKKINKIL